MKKSIAPFLAGLSLACVPYLLLSRANAQGSTLNPIKSQPVLTEGGGDTLMDDDYIYVVSNKTVYKMTKGTLTIMFRTKLD